MISSDSFAGAAGKGPETADAGIALMDALHAVGRTSLVVAHIAKGMSNGGQPSDDSMTAYGSVFNTARPRNSWALKVEKRDDSELIVRIIHRKINLGRRRPPQYLRLAYEGSGDVPDRIHVSVPNPEEFVVDDDRLYDLVAGALTTEWQTTTEIFRGVRAVEEQVGYESVRTVLKRMAAEDGIEHQMGRGKGHPAKWRRAAEDL